MKEKTPVLRYPHIASRVFDQPLMVEHQKLLAILNVLGPRLGFDAPAVDVDVTTSLGAMRDMDMLVKAQRVERRDEGHYVADGVAVVPVVGTLIQRGDWMSAMSGMMSYGQVERMFGAAMDDPQVKEIIFEIDSPGGEVAGAFDMADRMYSARGKKPMTAIATERAASAAYLIASAADEVVVPRTGYVGSVGVVATHIDYSKALEKKGVAVTILYSGSRKADGNPYQPLPNWVKAEWQEELDEVYGLFVKTVARNRGITESVVRTTEAAMLMGRAGVDAGLANRVNSFDNEFDRLALRSKQAGGYFLNDQRKETQMTTELEKRATAEAEAKLRAEAEVKAKADQEAKAKADAETKVKADAEAKARAEAGDAAMSGAKEASSRIQAILECDEAKGREATAKKLAFGTSLSASEAKEILATTPKAGSALDRMMENFQPGVSDQEAPPAAGVIDSPSVMYARRAEQYAKAQPR